MTHQAFNEMPSWEKELYDAVHKDDVPTFKAILAREDVRRYGNLGRPVWDTGKAPLHEAAGCGRKRMISEMKEAGFNIDSLDVVGEAGQGFTALHLAVFNKKDSTVRLLLDLGADQSVLGNFHGCSGTPLDWAKKKRYKSISKMLERSAARPFEGLDDMAKLRQRPKILADLKEAYDTRDKIAANREELREVEEKLIEAKRLVQTCETKHKKLTEYGQILKELPTFKAIADLERNLEITEEASIRLRGIVVAQPEPPANPNVGECPDCFTPPDEVFSCQNCGYWVCQDCRRDVVNCFQCGQESYVKPLQRNRGLERVLREN